MKSPGQLPRTTPGIYVAGFVYQNSTSVYGYALVKFRPDSLPSGSVTSFIYDPGILSAVKNTTANGGRAYAAGTVWNDNTASLDWCVLACSTGLRPSDADPEVGGTPGHA